MARVMINDCGSKNYSSPSQLGETGLTASAVAPDLRMWELCRMMPLIGEFSLGSPVSPAFTFQHYSLLTLLALPSSALNTSMSTAAQTCRPPDESEIQHYKISWVQYFYIGTKIKLDPSSELGSFDLGSGKMLVEPGIRRCAIQHHDNMTASVNIRVLKYCFYHPSSHLAVEIMLKRCTRRKDVVGEYRRRRWCIRIDAGDGVEYECKRVVDSIDLREWWGVSTQEMVWSMNSDGEYRRRMWWGVIRNECRSYLQAQLEYELLEQSRFAVLEDAHLAQRVEVHVYGDLCLELVGQGRQHPLLVQSLLVGPGVGEPAYDTCLQFAGHSPERHVLLHAVHPSLEFDPCHVHVANHAANVANYCREDEHAGQEVCHHKQVLSVVLWLRRLSCNTCTTTTTTCFNCTTLHYNTHTRFSACFQHGTAYKQTCDLTYTDIHALPGIRTQSLPHHRSEAHQSTAPREVCCCSATMVAPPSSANDRYYSCFLAISLDGGQSPYSLFPALPLHTSPSSLHHRPRLHGMLAELLHYKQVLHDPPSSKATRHVTDSRDQRELISHGCFQQSVCKLVVMTLFTPSWTVDGNTARLTRRSDEALGVRVSVARIAPSLLDLGRAATTLDILAVDNAQTQQTLRNIQYVSTAQEIADVRGKCLITCARNVHLATHTARMRSATYIRRVVYRAHDRRYGIPHNRDPLSLIGILAAPSTPVGSLARTYGGKRKGGPVEAVYVLAGERAVLGSVQVVDPVVRAKSDCVANGEVEASVPVDEH
ncbi:hypothetical protein PR048_033702 [Dryococelus australis]|uniref:Uncharacterized protein n=1 Tax=Dryococelus australis TaxID=614101 RepID=A0ABQ9G1X0_9NEOP|nr:hypothetical protein PR048_033702 [Dryococelus australis]